MLAFPLAFILISLIVGGLFLLVLRINHGVFTYTIDDPYIHLALSSQIRHGNYGINAAQYSAPASSILFPFLLAPASGTSLHPYLPLILNALALLVTMEIIRRLFVHLELSHDSPGTWTLAGTLVTSAIFLNMIGVVFTGLEHSLHIALVAAVIYGLVLFLDRQEMPRWLPLAIILCPLIRYEGLPLCLAALLVLAMRGRWRTAAITFGVMVALVGGFSCFLIKLGLPPLPSSVLAKSGVAAQGLVGDGSLIGSFIINAEGMYAENVGLLLLLIGVIAGIRFLLEVPGEYGRWTSKGLMSLVLCCMVAGHAFAGKFGWFDRYEIYLLVGALLIGVYLAQNQIRHVLAEPGYRRLILVTGAFVCLMITGAKYAKTTLEVPLAANDIYQQQFQMHRFANNFYRAPVAVNDLGLVSYRNPNFVLDLGGLASEKARILNVRKAGAAAYRDLLNENGVHLAIIYDEWFRGRVPAEWVKVGSMDLSRAPVSVAEREVQFYATDASTADTLRKELVAFKTTLPQGVKLTVH